MNPQEIEKALIMERLNKQRDARAEKMHLTDTKMLRLFVQHLHLDNDKKPYIQYPGKCKLRAVCGEKTPEEPIRRP
jgi:hypothetical protein